MCYSQEKYTILLSDDANEQSIILPNIVGAKMEYNTVLPPVDSSQCNNVPSVDSYCTSTNLTADVNVTSDVNDADDATCNDDKSLNSAEHTKDDESIIDKHVIKCDKSDDIELIFTIHNTTETPHVETNNNEDKTFCHTSVITEGSAEVASIQKGNLMRTLHCTSTGTTTNDDKMLSDSCKNRHRTSLRNGLKTRPGSTMVATSTAAEDFKPVSQIILIFIFYILKKKIYNIYWEFRLS